MLNGSFVLPQMLAIYQGISFELHREFLFRGFRRRSAKAAVHRLTLCRGLNVTPKYKSDVLTLI
jgi:hypothetical protein